MSTAWRATARTFVATLAVIFPLAAAVPATGAVVINEVDSDPTDFVELYNPDAVAVDISGYVIRDNNNGNSFTVPGGTLLVAGGTYLADNLGFGLGSADSARLFDAANAALDSYSWTAHAITTYGRCPDGTGALSYTNGPTPGAANNCPPAATAWPGSPTISIADGAANVFGGNLSGLAYQPSGSAAPGVLWAVRNNASTLFRLVSVAARGSRTPATAGVPARRWSTPTAAACRTPRA